MGDTRPIEKLLLLVAWVRKHPDARVADVARAIGIRPEEVAPLVDKLSLCGKPPFSPGDLIEIWIDYPDRIHVELDQSLGRPLRFTAHEALALSIALGALPGSGAGPWADLAKSALARLRATLPADLAARTAELSRRILIEPSDRGGDERFAVVGRAFAERRAVDIVYHSASRDEISERRLRPYALIEHLGAWYAVGHDDRRGAVRTFKVERIREARLSDEKFEIPRQFDAARFRDAGMFVGGPGRRARILFAQPVARLIAEEWGDAAEALPDGSVVLGIDIGGDAGGVEWLAAWVMSFAGRAEALEPEELRRAIAARCRAALG